MAVARVQADWDRQAGSDTTLTYNSGLTMTGGNLIEGIVAWSGNSESVSSITDNLGNTYTVGSGGGLDDIQTGTERGVSFYAKNITGGAGYTITVNFSGAVTQRTVGFRELSGADTATPLAAHAAQAQADPDNTTDNITSTAATPSANDCWISGWVGGGGVPDDIAAGTGFSADAGIGLPGVIEAEHLTQTTAASVAATFTDPAGGADAVSVLTFMMAFKPQGAAAPDPGGPGQAIFRVRLRQY